MNISIDSIHCIDSKYLLEIVLGEGETKIDGSECEISTHQKENHLYISFLMTFEHSVIHRII